VLPCAVSRGGHAIESFFLPGPAGRIECLLKEPTSPASTAPFAGAALVCHPHPLFGGTLHNKVVHATAGALTRAGLPAMRFNFRGAGLSDGAHSGGKGEQEDVRVALDHLGGRYPGVPLLVAGYSFGAFVGLSACRADLRVAALIGIGLPVALYDFSFLLGCSAPLSLIQGDEDQFGPLPLLVVLAARVPGGASLLVVKGATHGFTGKLDELARRVSEAIPATLRRDPRPGTV
jgi:hypothetical protein